MVSQSHILYLSARSQEKCQKKIRPLFLFFLSQGLFLQQYRQIQCRWAISASTKMTDWGFEIWVTPLVIISAAKTPIYQAWYHPFF
jgi:hypothetical protein